MSNYSFAIVEWWSHDTDDFAMVKTVPCEELDEAEETLKKMYNYYYEMHDGLSEFINKDCYLHTHNARLVFRKEGKKKKTYWYFRIIGVLEKKYWYVDTDELRCFDDLHYE